MAILKHIASKNADYGEAQRYLIFQYDESTNKPIPDENGELIPRKEYIMDGINCDPFTLDMECQKLNALYHKNKSYDEIKSHHYIFSFDPKDAIENGLTGEQAQQIGMEYAKKNFPDHQALVCTHMDGHNESGNIHVHIVINSLRKYDVERQDVSCCQEDFQKLLFEKYNVRLKVSRGRFSYLHPERSKYITGRMLGTHYEENHLQELFKENAESKENKKETVDAEKYNTKPEETVIQPSNLLHEESLSILFIKSDLRLVVNLQDCVKAQQNAAYANKVKLSNLKEMSKTVAYIQEHGYDTRGSLEDSFSEIKGHASASRKDLKSVEDNLRKVNEQIHYTGQYLANKSIYQKFVKAKNKGQFRQEHPTEIALYESARKFLKEQSTDGQLPSMKLLNTEKEKLLRQKKEAQKTYHYYRDYQKELNTVCSNVDKILGQPHTRQPEKQKGTDIS